MSQQAILPCIFGDCNVTFQGGHHASLDCSNDTLLHALEKHLMTQHQLVIDSIVDIADLCGYLSHWRTRINQETAKAHCFVFHPGPATTSGAAAGGVYATTDSINATAIKPTEYLFLSYENPEDAQLREELHLKRLADVTDAYQRERNSQENLPCIFCNDVSLNRQKIFEHLLMEHSFQLGDPDNMVFVPELLQRLADMINSHVCLYCEKQFRDRFVLKEHMRKRNHRRVKPANSAKYAKYFLSNYLEQDGLRLASQQQQHLLAAMGNASLTDTNAATAAAAAAATADSEDEEDVSKAIDDEDSTPSNQRLAIEDYDKELLPDGENNDLLGPICALCRQNSTELDDPMTHLLECHSVDLRDVSSRHRLDFYQRLRLLALIRDRPGEPVDSLAVEAKRPIMSPQPATQWEVTVADLCDDI